MKILPRPFSSSNKTCPSYYDFGHVCACARACARVNTYIHKRSRRLVPVSFFNIIAYMPSPIHVPFSMYVSMLTSVMLNI